MLNLRGVIVPIATPMNESGDIDPIGTAKLLTYVIKGGVSGIFALGSTGEFSSLTHNQKKVFVELVAKELRGKVSLYVGISSTCDPEMVESANEAKAFGADAVVVMPPFYFSFANQSTVADYLENLADRMPLPMVLYNSSGGKGNLLTSDTVARLAHHPKIVGIKDTSGNFRALLSIVVATRNSDKPFAILPGNDFQMAPSVLFGTSGGVNSLANVAPRLFVDAYQAAISHDLTGLGDVVTPNSNLARIHTLCELYQVPPNAITTIKSALSLMGICGETVAKPLEAMNDDGRMKIRSILEKIGLL